VNVEQAPKRVMWKPTRLNNGKAAAVGEASDERSRPFHRGNDDGMDDKETRSNTGSPSGGGV